MLPGHFGLRFVNYPAGERTETHMRSIALGITLATILTLSSPVHAQSQFSATITSPFASPGDRFGSVMVGGMENASLGLTPFLGSYMGPLNTVVSEPAFIVGAKHYGGARGRVTVLSATTGNELWPQSQPLIGDNLEDYFGASVDKTVDFFDSAGNLAPDGLADVIIGAPQKPGSAANNGPTGYVRIVSSAGTGNITIPGMEPNEQFGIKVGTVENLVLVTANRAASGGGINLAGRIYVYRAADILAQQSAVQPACRLSAQPLTGAYPADRFGYSWVFLPHGPGGVPALAVGAPIKGGQDQFGGVYFFSWSDIQSCTGGTVRGVPLDFNPDPVPTETDYRQLGAAVATGPSGDTLVIGAPKRTLYDHFGDEFTVVPRYNSIGAAYIFRDIDNSPLIPPFTSGLPVQLASPEIVYGPLAEKSTLFGSALAMTSDKLFVGSMNDRPTALPSPSPIPGPVDPGSISIYSTVNAQTTYSHLVHAPNAQTGNFGASIAIGGLNGSVVAVGDSGVEFPPPNTLDSKVYILNMNGLGAPLVTHYGDGCSRAPSVKVLSTVLGRPIIGEELSAFVQNMNNMIQKAAITYAPGKPSSAPITLPGIACAIPGIYPNAPIIGTLFSYNPDSSPAMYAGSASALAPLSSNGWQFVTTVAAMDPVDRQIYLSNFQRVRVIQW